MKPTFVVATVAADPSYKDDTVATFTGHQISDMFRAMLGQTESQLIHSPNVKLKHAKCDNERERVCTSLLVL